VAKRTASAKKQARAGVKRSARNRAAKSEVKTLIVKARKALAESPVAESERFATTLEAVRALDRAAAKGGLHRRLAKQLSKVAAAAPAAAPAKGKRGAASAPRPAAPAPATKKK